MLWSAVPQTMLFILKGECFMQTHMPRLVEVTEDIDGFKEPYNNIIPTFYRKGEYCYGQEQRKRKGILQTGYC